MIKLHDCVCSTCAAVVNIPFTIISRTYGIDHIEQAFLSPETIDLLAPNRSIADSNKILSMIFYCEDAEFKPIFCTFSIVGALFGAIHCFAWNSSFPTISEQLYWRSASSTLVVSCVAALRSVFPWDNPASTGFWITICWFFYAHIRWFIGLMGHLLLSTSPYHPSCSCYSFSSLPSTVRISFSRLDRLYSPHLEFHFVCSQNFITCTPDTYCIV